MKRTGPDGRDRHLARLVKAAADLARVEDLDAPIFIFNAGVVTGSVLALASGAGWELEQLVDEDTCAAMLRGEAAPSPAST